MGLWSSEQTTVGTSVSRAVADNLIISSATIGVMNSLMGGSGNGLVESINASVSSGMGGRTEWMMNYAKTKYPIGLPTGKVSTTADGKQVVMSVLKGLTNPGITEEYYHLGAPNNLHIGWMALVNDYGHITLTNELTILSTQKGFPVYLSDMVVVVPQDSLDTRTEASLVQWGTPPNVGFSPERSTRDPGFSALRKPSPPRAVPTAGDDFIEVSYAWVVPTEFEVEPERTVMVNGIPQVVPAIKVMRDVLHTEALTIPIQGYDKLQDYFHIKYRNGYQDGYWMYKLYSGGHPEIDTIFEAPTNSLGEFFPYVYFRRDKAPITDTAPEYAASERMLKVLGIDYAAVIESMGQNPDISEVEQAFLTFAVPANTTNQAEQRYLFDFFSKLYLASGGVVVGAGWENIDINYGVLPNSSEEMDIDFINNLYTLSPRISIAIRDTKFTSSLGCKGVFKKKIAGVVAAVGEYASSFRKDPVNFSYTKKEPVAGNDRNEFVDVAYNKEVLIDVFAYQHQVTEHVYEEVVVYDLQMTYWVWNSFTTVGNDLDTFLLIPLDHSITKRYSVSERELLYSRSMHYVFNSRTTRTIGFFESQLFAGLLQFAALAYTVITMGADRGLVANAAAVFAGKAAASVLIKQIVLNILIGAVVVEVGKLLVKEIGGEAAIILAAIITAVAISQGYESSTKSLVPWADKVLQLSTGLMKSVEVYYSDALQELAKRQQSFIESANEQIKQLEEAKDLLNTRSVLSTSINWGQTPDQLYNSTVHSGNVGIASIDAVSSYVKSALTLPTLNHTLGVFRNE